VVAKPRNGEQMNEFEALEERAKQMEARLEQIIKEKLLSHE
jgi:hypothetical protein